MRKHLVVVFIVAAGLVGIGAVGWFYYSIFSMAGFPPALRIMIILAAAGLMSGLIYVGFERVREIEKGDDDDLGEY